jgi:diaminopimelate decarboxylase
MQSVDFFKNNLKLLLRIVKEVGTPVFVTDVEILKQKVANIQRAFNKNCLLFYAIKANFNPAIINILKEAGINGIETISPFEINLAKKLGFDNNQILFTGNNCDADELEQAKNSGVIVNLGSISELNSFAKRFYGTEISIRINPGFGDGEFKQIITGGKDSKFGIYHTQIHEALKIIKDNNLKLIGLHCHLGSGLYDTKNFTPMVDFMFKLANQIEGLKFIDLGGGFGVRYKPADKEVDLTKFASVIDEHYEKYQSLKSNNIKIIFEPGKYLVAESTFLLTKITNIRDHNKQKIVGVNTGFNHIIRPALYSSYHHIINISKLDEAKEAVKIVGNICESTDVINENIELSNPKEGDIVAILTAGAYCSSMSSLYNLRPYAPEVLINGNEFAITRERMNFEKTMSSMGFKND